MIYINGKRDGYAEEQCNESLTVADLIEILSQYDENEKVYLMNDGGYTYGSITKSDVSNCKDDLGYRY